MGTRSYIGKDIGNGKYSVIFCQLESYLETTGRLLTEHYNTPEKVDALLALGDICFLGEKIEPDPSLPHDWYGKDYQQDVTLAFGRDCGEYKWARKRNDAEDMEEKRDEGIEFMPFRYLVRNGNTERNAGYLLDMRWRDGMSAMNLPQNQRYSIKTRGTGLVGKIMILFFLCESENENEENKNP